jgi:uncharacterized membrane protein
MTRYDAYKFIHVTAAIVWLGAGVMIQVLAARAQRTRDDDYLQRLFRDAGVLSKVLFIPASLTVVVFGVLMVVDGPWDFEPLWIVLGLCGYATTFVTGAFILGPRAEKTSARYEQEGRMTPSIAAEMRRVLLIARVDTVVLFLVVAVMVIKPTGDDAGILVAMAAVLAAGIGTTVASIRGVQVEATATS